MIAAIIMWAVAIVLLLFSALWFETVGEEVARGAAIKVKAGRLFGAGFAAAGIALIILAVRP
jgi:hypothetical protein